ncbi:MAG TPA: metal-dependent transcriptional regulator [Flavobacteriaceae bacterium]|nr:metal-dependent transcriptional regulator [Flavobacteriaceae bacterium]MCB9212076.1 metal-dependent transcriptional regulator [Alteromonas sp.]HPF09828.1 metal-dependent transcriptional regulator [Flavobacteriaceae bacterium]HQU22032.1 metal-dependent transcriptional regulator [Flavobacteriaceae bacterium]HQU64087.1 metal-dependent transcriptional regulator [Flavobacteriaceae bacterium]
MNLSNPIQNLLLFAALALFLYLFFRPVNGWYWIIKNNLNSNRKVVIEDLLKQLYTSENAGTLITTNDLTLRLKYKNHQIIEVLQEMALTELIVLAGDQIQLTPLGREYAVKIVRVHRLWEKYLAEKTGFDKSEWHHRAEDMEHRLDHEATNELAVKLGNPIFDPHGDPIPSELGNMAEITGSSMVNLPVNTLGKIVHIEDEPDVIYKQILAENIHIGSQIRIVENTNKRVVFYSEGEEFILAPIVAANLTVEPLDAASILEEDAVRLSSLQQNEMAEILGISKECRGESRRRLLDLGFVRGTPIQIDLVSPLSDTKAYLVKGSSIALRTDQAAKVLIKKLG